MKNRHPLQGLATPVTEIFPPEFDAETISSFFTEGGAKPVGPLKSANSRAAVELKQPAKRLEDAPEAEARTDVSRADDSAFLNPLPEQAENAIAALKAADDNAPVDLWQFARPLQELHEREAPEFDDAAGKPAWAGGGGGDSTKKGKGHNKGDNTDTGGTDTGGTDTGGTDTGGTDTGGTDTGGTDTGGTDTGGTETNPGSSDPNVYVSGMDNPDGYNIELVFEGSWTDARRQQIENASEAVSDIITTDLASHNGIDDIRITVRTADIDGSGGSWATGGHRAVRPDSLLPSTGVLTFDNANLSSLDSSGLWDELATHEILHAMGFGTLFDDMGMVQTIDGQKRFTGTNAIEAYNAEFASIAGSDPYSDLGVQLDSSGAHWHDATFTKELMTPNLRYSGNYLSDMSIAALEDMGYSTIYDDAVTIA